ncbi:hypothetical protein H5410_045271 [Solanum commersonii]|uniref:Uncharacterized protein n=1 Tax=Solanum commersonii TaxID=4109 RepID=A0A9J5XB61_SOLCO|nr:hypothetical protein H5410_045271 [Solanum commersonii]
MSPNRGLINTPNLNFYLSSSKTQVQQFKKDVSNSATQDPIMSVHTRLNLLMQGSIIYLKTQVVTHHYQRFSRSQYLLQMQVQAQLRYSNALTQRMILYSHTMVQLFKAPKSNATLTLTKKNTMQAFTHRFARSGFEKGHVFIKFLPKKGKAQRWLTRGSHTHKVGHKRGIYQIGSHSSKLPKIISRDSLT